MSQLTAVLARAAEEHDDPLPAWVEYPVLPHFGELIFGIVAFLILWILFVVFSVFRVVVIRLRVFIVLW